MQRQELNNDTTNAWKFYKFLGEVLKQKNEENTESIEVSSRFQRASTVLLSNPYWKDQIRSISSMEEVLKIKNPKAIEDMLT